MRKLFLALACGLLVGTTSGCIIPAYSGDPARRTQQLMFTSENLRLINDEWERIWFWYILAWSFVSLLFSLLPAALGGLGFGPSTAWPLCSVSLAIIIVVAISHGIRRGWRLHRSGVAHPQPLLTSATLLPAVAAVALLLSSLAGLGPPPSGAYQYALFVTLGLACGSFLLFLQYPLSE